MNAQEITKALGGRWHGASGEARCPAHEDKTPSLSLRDGNDGTLLTHCHARCSPQAVWAALQDRGLVERAKEGPRERRHRRSPQRPAKPIPEPPPNQDYALEIWRAARPATGTPAEDYLRGRGITIPVPPSIRYHPAVKHTDTGLHLPCFIAAACNIERQVTGIQRIYLTHDGRRAPLRRDKMALGLLRGSAVRLGPATDRVWLTEGVEDALALMQMMGEPAWAVLGTSGYKTVEIPKSIKQVILAPDGDDAGQGVIQETGARLADQGHEVRAAKMPAGQDWCDLLGDYEERATILEFDLGLKRKDAEAQARRETIDG